MDPANGEVVMSTDSGRKSAVEIAKRAPHWAALVLIVGAFLLFMERQQSAADRVAEQRIQICHRVQSESTEVLKDLQGMLQSHASEWALLRASLEKLHGTLKDHEAILHDHKRELRVHAELLREGR